MKAFGNIIFFVCVFLFAFLTLLFSACKKEPTDSNPNDCFTIPPYKHFGHGYNYICDTVKVCMPFFNPNNDDEFLYVRSSNGVVRILKYNLQSKSVSLIHTGEVWSSPQWGKNDWILFSSNCHIFKIKSNGDSLTQLTNTDCYHYPRWYFETDEFVAGCMSLQTAIKFDLSGNILDTLPISTYETSTTSNFPYFVINAGGPNWVLFVNCLTFNNDFVYSYLPQMIATGNSGTMEGSIFWVSNSDVIYSNSNGLNRLSIPSLVNHNFKKTCNSRLYYYGSVNRSKTKMIWSRNNITYIDEFTLYCNNRIYNEY